MFTSADVLSDEERLAAFITTRTELAQRKFVTRASFVNLFIVPAMLAAFAAYFSASVFVPGDTQLLGAVGAYVGVGLIGYRWAMTVGARRVNNHRAAIKAAAAELDAICASTMTGVAPEFVVRNAIELGCYHSAAADAERLLDRFEIGSAAHVCREAFYVIGLFRKPRDADNSNRIADLAVCFLDPSYAGVFDAVRSGWVTPAVKASSSFTSYHDEHNSTLAKAVAALRIADLLAAHRGAFDVFFTLADDAGGRATQHELAQFAHVAISVVAV